MFVRFLFVFDLLFNLFRTALWPSVGKELSPCLSTCAVFSLPEQSSQRAIVLPSASALALAFAFALTSASTNVKVLRLSFLDLIFSKPFDGFDSYLA